MIILKAVIGMVSEIVMTYGGNLYVFCIPDNDQPMKKQKPSLQLRNAFLVRLPLKISG